jgi:hypothetical protein
VRLIFLDESARDDRYYFFGALIVDANSLRFIERGLDEIAALLATNVPAFAEATEFHAVDMFHGRNAWRPVPVVWRVKACDLVAKVIARSGAAFVFRGVDVQAQRQRYGRRAFAPHLLTLAHTLEEVDRQLAQHDPLEELGLAVADEHHSARGARRSLRAFKILSVPGYTQGPLTRIADTIYFGPSDESRLLQAADVATYFMNRHYTVVERDDRARRSVAKIIANIRSVTVDEYVWHP